MKLNLLKTAKVGLAFAIIMMFWNAYDFVVPLLLDNVYGLPDDIRGLIMGLDNLLSLFLLPLFGKFSDKTKNSRGKRTPYIFFGTIISVCLMIFVPISASSQLKASNALRSEIEASVNTSLLIRFYDDAEKGLNTKYCDIKYLSDNGMTKLDYVSLRFVGISKEGKGDLTKYFVAEQEVTKDIYEETAKTNANYNKFVKGGLNTYISDNIYSQITQKNWGNLILYMFILLLVLLAMATFRSPAVALMPDVTPKPLRSRANAIINLAGGVGGALSFLIYTIWFAISKYAYTQIFITVGVGMLALLFLFLLLVKEPKLVSECEETVKKYGIKDEADVDEITGQKNKMSKAKRMSFFLILGSIFMWFMGYNAIVSNLSIYATRSLLFEPSIAGVISAVALGFSAIAFIPVGWLATKIGRKNSILIGFSLAVVAFILIALFVKPDWTKYMFIVFYLISSIGLIVANVNTFPMVVELANDSDVGKYTGIYYTATMSAQAITPYIAGLFMKMDARYLFVYGAVCIVIAILLMAGVKKGDSERTKGNVVA